jgi:hypothetical protein
MKYFLMLSFLITSCGVSQKSSNKEFIEYTQRFTQYTGINVTVPINFSSLKDYVGVCITYSDGRKEIEIDLEFWDESEDLAREEVIFHELGHCVLDRDHDETLVKPSGYFYRIPNSVMYPYVFGHAHFYEEFHEHYVEELVDPGKQL